MEEKKQPTGAEEHNTPEAPVADGPGTTPAQPAPGDVVVPFEKIEELMAEQRAAARHAVEQAEPLTPEAPLPASPRKRLNRPRRKSRRRRLRLNRKSPAVAVPRRLKKRSRPHPRQTKSRRRQSPAGTAHPRLTRRPPTRPSCPNLETKCPKVKRPQRSRRLPPRNRPPLAVVLAPVPGSRRSPRHLRPRPVLWRRASWSI